MKSRKTLPADFREIVRDIRTLTLPLLDKRARKNYLSVKALAEGQPLAKQEKMTMKHLIRQRRQQKDKLARIAEQEKQTQVKLLRTKALDNQGKARFAAPTSQADFADWLRVVLAQSDS